MLTKDLIKQLQDLVNQHESVKDVMGEHEIVIDTFRQEKVYDVFGALQSTRYKYAGFSPNVVIEKSRDGVYDILTAFETDTN